MSLPPSGEIPQGAIRFNTDSQKLEFYAQGEWWVMSTDTPNLARGVDSTPGPRGVLGRQYTPSILSKIEYLNISSTGNSQEFGDLTIARHATGSCSSSTRGIWGGGEGPTGSVACSRIDFVTIASTGDAQNFGDLDGGKRYVRGVGNETRGVFAGGFPSAPTKIEHITIATTGAIADFGSISTIDGSVNFMGGGTAASSTRGLYMGMGNPSGTNVIQFVTIHTLGNTQDFGDLTGQGHRSAGASNAIRGIRFGQLGTSKMIDYVTIATTGNAIDFGEMPSNSGYNLAMASPNRIVVTRGFGGGSYTNEIKYVQIATTGDAVDFGDMTSGGGDSSGCSNAHGGL